MKTTTFILSFLVAQLVVGQSNEELALEKGKKAIQLMENGHINESI